MLQKYLSLIRKALSFGPDSRIFDGLLVSGPFVVALVAVFGRTAGTTALASTYLLAFVAAVASAWRQR